MHQLDYYYVYMEVTQLVPLVCNILGLSHMYKYRQVLVYCSRNYKHLYIYRERETVVSWHLVIIM